MTVKEMGNKRLFVGNLFPEVTQEDLEQRFSKFGSVSKIEIKSKKDIDGKITQTFAFIDIGVTDTAVSQCISTLANKKWKGYLMSVQQARESFMERLARERKEREANEDECVKPEVQKGDAFKAVKRSFDDDNDDFKIVNNKSKAPKRDYTEEREEFKGFGNKVDTRQKYDPLKLFKSKLAGEVIEEPVEEIPNTENMGKVENGIILFENEEAGKEKLLAVNKVYHSSSEDEEKVIKQAQKKLKKKKVKEDIKSAEFKDKMTKRFLEKQKASQESVSDVKTSKKANKNKNSKYYEDTSDEEEEDIKDASGKTGAEVLKTFQSFSNFWQDSDNEEEEIQVSKAPEKELQQEVDSEINNVVETESENSDSEETDDTDSDESDEEEEDDVDDETKEGLVKETPKLVSDVTMPRYDPTSENHEQFLRSNDDNKEEQDESSAKPEKFFEVKTDLKKVFGSKPEESSGFSFGFNKDEKSESKEGFSFGFQKESQEAAIDVDSDGDEIIVKKKDDVASKFGLQLKGKGVPKSENTFFFTSEEDPRLEVGIAYFFDSKIDLDKLRQDHNERRPILSDILKKRTRNKAKRNEGSKNAFGKRKSTSWQTGGKRKKFNK